LVGVSQISKYRDRAWRASLKVVSYFIFFAGIDLSHAQAGTAHSEMSGKPTQSSTDATLSVSLTVVGSITVFFGPNREQTLVIANAPAPEMRQMLAAFEESNEAPHLGKKLRSRKMHPDVLGKVQSTGKER
jgi:hypothetical protein